MIKAIRKKESVIKEVIISEVIIWMVGLALAIFVIAWPREYALDFFMMIEHMHIDRIYLGLAIIILTLIISVVIFFLLAKETRWNNRNLNLAPIELSIDQIIINNYDGKDIIDVDEIVEIKIMNHDSVLQIKTKDEKTHLPDHLKNTREVYESLKNTMASDYPSIVFTDSTNKGSEKWLIMEAVMKKTNFYFVLFFSFTLYFQ